MAANSGTAGSVVIVAGGTAIVGEIAEWSASFGMDPVEVTAFGDNWREYVPSVRGVTGSFSGNWDGTDAIQGSVDAYMRAGSALTLRLYENASKYYSGSAYVTGAETSISQTGKAEVSYAFTGSGAWSLT